MGGSINQNVLDGIHIENPMDHLMWFAKERQDIYTKKEAGESWPWTSDKTLQHYKFCNIFRDQDRTTVDIVNWVKPLSNNIDALFANLLYCRMSNNPDVWAKTGYIYDGIDWIDPDEFIAIITEIGGGKKETGDLAGQVNKRSVWKDPYQIAGAFSKRLGIPNRETLIATHIPKVNSALLEIVLENAGSETMDKILAEMAEVWGYKNNMVFTHTLLDLSYFRPDLVSPNIQYPLGDGATPVLRLLGSEDPIKDIMEEWSARYPDERPMFPMDAEGALCEWRKYNVWSRGLARKTRVYHNAKNYK